MTTFPKVDQTLDVSTVINPVTHTAEVDVNQQSRNPTLEPGVCEIGSSRASPPINDINKKPTASRRDSGI